MRAAPVALVVIATLAPWGAADARPKKKKASELVDISAARAQLKVLTDSDGGIYVMDSGYRDDTMVFYGDKKVLYRQRIIGGGANGPAYSFRFWAPRVDHRTDIGRKDNGDYFVSCGDQEEILKPVSDGDARAVLDKAAFKPAMWKYQGHVLARDVLTTGAPANRVGFQGLFFDRLEGTADNAPLDPPAPIFQQRRS